MDDPSAFTLAREPDVRAALSRSGRTALHFRVLTPPYPAVGVGVLRVLRVRERDSLIEVIAGYERYDRQ